MPKPSLPKFVPYATMYKLEGRDPETMVREAAPRYLECVNCGIGMTWSVYALDPEEFDSECHECKMTAAEYWKDKMHRKLEKEWGSA